MTKSEDARLSWPETWMLLASTISRRSCDPRLKVGCVIVSSDNTRVLGLGYNGNYRGGPNAPESLEPGMSGLLHAELNCLLKCDYSIKDKVMYVTHSPCRMCCKMIVNAGVSSVVYLEEYRDTSGLEILKSSGVTVNRYADVLFSNTP